MLKIIKRLPPIQLGAAIFFLLVQTFTALYLPYLMSDMVNNGVLTGNMGYILKQGIWMGVLTILSLFGQVMNTYISAKIAYRLGANLRGDLYRKVMSFSRKEFDQYGTVTLITRNTNDVTQVQNLVEMGLKFLIIAPLYLIGGISMTFLLSPKLAMVFIALIPFLTIAAIIIYQFANPLYAKMQILVDKLNLYFREGLMGVKVIRAFCKENTDYEKYRDVNSKYTDASITAATIMSVFVPIITLLVNLAILVIVWIGADSVSNGTMDVGAIMGAISYSGQILMAFGILTNVILTIPKGQISVKRVNDVLETPLSLLDGEKLEIPDTEVLRFEHVDFRYPNGSDRILEDISFTARKGQTIAIIGSTGDGKSSLVGLLPRFYDVEKGSITIGGVDIRRISQTKLHDMISFTSQKSTLFMGTIRDNMLMGNPNATDEEIWNALDGACASEFVKNLDNGLDSKIDKNGGNFSGGQKQRLCIARSLLKKSDIYVFDDTFSALDFKTDAAIRSLLKLQMSNTVTIIVAQRVSTIADADAILVLENGKMEGFGTHQELLQKSRVYQEIVNSQTYKEAVA